MIFTCQRCGNCCTQFKRVRITKAELKQIAKRCSIPWQQLRKFKKLEREGNNYYLKFPCMFLNPDKSCRIYDIRPQICRDFPLLPFLSDPQRYTKQATICPELTKLLQVIP